MFGTIYLCKINFLNKFSFLTYCLIEVLKTAKHINDVTAKVNMFAVTTLKSEHIEKVSIIFSLS